MHPTFPLVALLILCWPIAGHASTNGDRSGYRPAHLATFHRDLAYPQRPRESAKTVKDPDWTMCDNAATGPDAAIAACGKVIIRKNPRILPLAYVRRGQAWQTKGDYARATADFADAIRLRPGVSGYFALRAGAHEKAGEMDAALRDYQQAVKLDPGDQDALNSIRQIETRGVGGAPASPPAAGTATPSAGAAMPGPAAARVPAMAVAPPAAAAPVIAATPAPASAAPPPAPAAVGGRVALVVGNGAYVNANALPNPPNDARAMAKALRAIGFDVVEGANLDRAAMETAVRDFLHQAANARVVLLFYAGHGMQVDGKNYLVPIDAKLAAASDLAFETIDVDKILDALSEPGHTNIILLDACRDNPLARSFASRLPPTRSAAVSSGLAAYSSVGTGTLIAYATAPGQTALDGAGGNSPFTASLLHNIATPGLEIRQVLTRVRAEVASETSNRQIPWDNSSLMGDVFLVK